MSLSIPSPTLVEILNALRSVLVTDATNVSGLIPTTLQPYGITLDATTTSPHDSSELQNIKIGSRGNLPPGLSIFFFPGRKKARWYATPNERQADYIVHIQGYWTDPPSTGPYLTQTPRLLWPMFCDLTEALEVVLGPDNLGALSGGWVVPNSNSGVVMNPFCATANACAWVNTMVEDRKESIYFCDLVWGGFKNY